MRKVLVDCRVFSTSAHDRGMGRYVLHLLTLLEAEGHEVSVLLFRNCYFKRSDPIFARFAVRFAAYDPEDCSEDGDSRLRACHEFTAFLSATLEADKYDVYLDATPFLGPMRLDLLSCPVLAVCYDFIPLKHPDFYLCDAAVRRVYCNGLTRVVKADGVVCISDATRSDARKFLGIDPSRLIVIYPALSARYRGHSAGLRRRPYGNYAFSVLGSHRSKNPDHAVRIIRGLLSTGRFGVRVNAPKDDQRDLLRTNLTRTDEMDISSSLSDEALYALQANARFILHLSIEEGFGIPLLEALFLVRKVVALDIAINREILTVAGEPYAGAALLLPPDAVAIDPAALQDFLGRPADARFYSAIREAFEEHWSRSAAVLTGALETASRRFGEWTDLLQAKMFSSIPGASCGVADYSTAYARSAAGNIAFFFSHGDPENLSFLPNVKVATYLDFGRFARGCGQCVKGMFNLAFSPELEPGIDLMRKWASKNDVVLIHERRYFDGLRAMLFSSGRVLELLSEFPDEAAAEEKSRVAIDCAFHPYFNDRTAAPVAGSPISSAWLKSLPVRFVSHLSPAVLEEMRALSASVPGSVINDLADIEDRLEFVPLGIDDRAGPGVGRAARRLRIGRGIQRDDILVGHFGLILDDLKRLRDLARAVLAYSARQEPSRGGGRRVFFCLVGKVIEAAVLEEIRGSFRDAGLAGRVIHTNPISEASFDAEIAACDAVFCLRRQNRGQQSHVFVRALALGAAVFVNRASGYGFDPRMTLDDCDLEAEVARALDLVMDPSLLHEMKTRARRVYELAHRGGRSLEAILNGSAA